MTASQKNLESSVSSNATAQHKPVLLKEVLEGFDPQVGQTYIDGTFGFGGHAKVLADKVGPTGRILGIDLDNEIVHHTKYNIPDTKYSNITLVHGSYTDMDRIAQDQGIDQVDGVLLDLGYNSWHVDQSGKGFTFQLDEPLDMRYDTSDGVSAAQIVNSYPEDKLAQIIKEYGEERYARPIAKAIVAQRKDQRIVTTKQLVDVIGSVMSGKSKVSSRINYATRTFQALRIEVNHELDNISQGLTAAMDILKQGGKLAVISFHSLEDRIVKNFFRDNAKRGSLEIITKKPIEADEIEQRDNPRARSAKLRIAIKR